MKGILLARPNPADFDTAAHVVQRPMDQAEKLRAIAAEAQAAARRIEQERANAATDEERRAALASLDWRRQKMAQIAGGK